MPAPLSDVQRVPSGGKLDDQWIFGVFNHSITTSVACQIHFLHIHLQWMTLKLTVQFYWILLKKKSH